jgi:hypothetical protein
MDNLKPQALWIRARRKPPMFDFVRQAHQDHHGRAVFAHRPLLRAPGRQRLQPQREATTVVATVDGRDITQAQWDSCPPPRGRSPARLKCPGWIVKLLDTPEAKLCHPRPLGSASAWWPPPPTSSGLSASDQRLAQRVAGNNPQIAMLRKADGYFGSWSKYQAAAAAAQGMTP